MAWGNETAATVTPASKSLRVFPQEELNFIPIYPALHEISTHSLRRPIAFWLTAFVHGMSARGREQIKFAL
jgi:hypothetical protein